MYELAHNFDEDTKGRYLRLSAKAFAAENLSGIGHSALCGMSLFTWSWFRLVPPIHELAHFLGPFEGPQGPHAAGAPGQIKLSICLMVIDTSPYAQI